MPPRPTPPVVFPGFRFDVLYIYIYIYIYINSIFVEKKPGNTTGGLGWGGAQRGGDGTELRRTRRRRVGPPRIHPSPPSHRETAFLHDSSETRTSEILCKPICRSPKPVHTTGESNRGARRGGGAGPNSTGRGQNRSPRRQASFVPSKASKTRRLNV